MTAKTPEESRIVGNFGEYALAFFLTKNGINVIRADTVFFDLIVKDSNGLLFDKNTIVGISVKLRDRSLTTPTCTIAHEDFESVKDYGKKWNIQPYFCHMIIFKQGNDRILEGFIFSLSDAEKYFADGKRKFAISFSKLRKDGYFSADKKNYFRWKL